MRTTGLFVGLIISLSSQAFAAQIVNKGTCAVVTTPAQGGETEFTIKVAGTFNGFDPDVSNGRFIRGIDIFTDDGQNGDRAFEFRVEDTDGVIPVPARAAFPNYPVISYLYDTEVVETATVKLGVWIKPGQIHRVESPTGMLTMFTPSGLHIKGKVKSSGQTTFRANLIIGKRE